MSEEIFDEGQNENIEGSSEPVIREQEVKNHPLYKELLSESIERRQTIKSLKEELETLKTSIPDTPQPEASSDAPVVQSNSDVNDLKAQVEELKQTLANQQLETARQKSLSDYGLPSGLAQFLTGNTVEEISAKAEELANHLKPNTPRDVSDVGTPENPVNDLQTRVLEKVLGKHKQEGSNIYDPNFATRHGGGVIRKN